MSRHKRVTRLSKCVCVLQQNSSSMTLLQLTHQRCRHHIDLFTSLPLLPPRLQQGQHRTKQTLTMLSSCKAAYYLLLTVTETAFSSPSSTQRRQEIPKLLQRSSRCSTIATWRSQTMPPPKQLPLNALQKKRRD